MYDKGTYRRGLVNAYCIEITWDCIHSLVCEVHSAEAIVHSNRIQPILGIGGRQLIISYEAFLLQRHFSGDTVWKLQEGHTLCMYTASVIVRRYSKEIYR